MALQEWHQNKRSCKSLFQQILIVYETFTERIKTKNQQNLGCGYFIKVL